MKCSNCRVDNTLKDRIGNSGRCKNCRQPFAFEPTTMRPPLRFTDLFFAQLIQDLSANNTLFFTETQFYYFLNRRLVRKSLQQSGCLSILTWVCIGFAGVMLFTGIVAQETAAIRFATLLLIAGVGFLMLEQRGKRKQRLKQRLKQQQPKTFPVNWATFREWHQQWQRAKGPTERQLQPVRQQAQQVEVNPQVSNYSFDRVVVCEHDDMAQMLIANNLHFEHNCVVISINGYPTAIFETVMTMLKRNPHLSVYALHDASPSGLRIPTLLRQPQWFPEPTVTIYDLGLLPRHALSLKNPFVIFSMASISQARQLPDEIFRPLSEDEYRWLIRGNMLALASFGPRRILQVISQGMGRVQLSTATANENEIYWIDSDDSLILFSDGFG